jgi:hypothetical protein
MCFCGCEALSTVTIEAGSRLSTVLDDTLFLMCRSLFIPSSLRGLFEPAYSGTGVAIVVLEEAEEIGETGNNE